MANCRPVSLTLLFVALLGGHFSLTHSSTESDANSVEIKVYPAKLSDWTTSTETTFKTTLANQATTYCGANPSSCGLDNGNTFSSADVTVHSKSESSRSLKFSVYISYPTGSNVTSGGSTTEQVPLAAVKVILKDARDSVKTNIDMYITYIGSDYYGVPPESTANGIIIPIAAVTVVAVGVSAVVMVYIQENREKKERAAARLARKRALKAVPNYNIPDVPSTTEGLSTEASDDVVYGNQDSQNQHKHNELKKRVEASAKTSITPSSMTPSSVTPSCITPSVNHFHPNGHSSNSSTLPPLSNNSNTAATITTTTDLSAEHHQEKYNHQEQQHQQRQRVDFEDSAEEEEKRRRKKEKKREKKRLLQQQRKLQELEQEGGELHDNAGFDTSAMTVSENSTTPRDNIPMFTVQRRGDVDV